MDEIPRVGLRDRKKLETRQRISDEATLLFLARGFEDVTVAEIAEAANVSKMTVFNYFPRKEDLFLDRVPEAREMLLATVRGRPDGVSPARAVGARMIELIGEDHPLGGAGAHGAFYRTVLASPALLARAREALDELEEALADVLREQPGVVGPDGAGGAVRAPWTAALIVTAVRTAYLAAARRILAGEDPAQVTREQPALVAELFAGVERALAAPDD